MSWNTIYFRIKITALYFCIKIRVSSFQKKIFLMKRNLPYFTKEASLCKNLKFSNLYIFATWSCKPLLIYKTWIIWYNPGRWYVAYTCQRRSVSWTKYLHWFFLTMMNFLLAEVYSDRLLASPGYNKTA